MGLPRLNTFTTARVVGGKLLRRALHRERLLREAPVAGIVDALLEQADREARGVGDGMVRVVVGPSAADSRVEAGPARRPLYPVDGPGLRLGLGSDPRRGAELWCKTADRHRLHATELAAAARGYDGAVLLGPEGQLREGTWFSLLVQLPGGWAAPPLGPGVIYSTTRAAVELHLSECGQPLSTQRLTLEDLDSAQGVIALSALLGVAPVVEVEGRSLPRCDVSRLRAALAR